MRYAFILSVVLVLPQLSGNNPLQAATSRNPAKAIYTKLKKVDKKLDRIQRIQKSTAKKVSRYPASNVPAGLYFFIVALTGLSGFSMYRSWRNSKALEFFMQQDFCSAGAAPESNRLQFQQPTLSGMNRPPVIQETSLSILSQVQKRMNELEASNHKLSALLHHNQSPDDQQDRVNFP